MADQDRDDTSPDDALAAAEEIARLEAAAETATDESNATQAAPKVVRPKARTSSRAAATSVTPAAAADPPVHARKPVVGTIVPASGPAPTGGELDGAVSLVGSGAAVVNARTVDVRQGGIGRVQAVDVAVSQGGIGLARGERVSVEMGGVGAAIAGEVHVTQGGVNTIIARDVRIEQAGVRGIIANNVHIERTTGVFIMVARHVEGDVRTLLDWRGAIAFGAAFGAVVSLFRRRRRG